MNEAITAVQFSDRKTRLVHTVYHEADSPGIGMYCSCGCASDGGMCGKPDCYHCGSGALGCQHQWLLSFDDHMFHCMKCPAVTDAIK